MRTCVGFLLLAFFVTGAAYGQGKTEEKQPAKGRRLPTYFKQLGLTPGQQDMVFKIMAEYKARIDQLSADLKKAKLDQKTELNKVLTPEQRKKLRELQTGEKTTESTTPRPKDGVPAKDKKDK